jgi:hypothetical protein
MSYKIEQRGFSKAWRKRIGDTLPKYLAGRVAPHGEKLRRLTTPAHRAAFSRFIEERIQNWLETMPEIAPHNKKLKLLAAEADKLAGKLQAATKHITRMKVRIGALSTDPEGYRYPSTAEGRLYNVATDSATALLASTHALSKWNQIWRIKKARPQAFAVQLTKVLQEEYLLFCGSTRGFKRLLVAINTSKISLVPELTITALEKRKQRKH